MLLLKCCIASWLAFVVSTFPERPSGRFAKLIPSPVWSPLVEYISRVEARSNQQRGARSGQHRRVSEHTCPPRRFARLAAACVRWVGRWAGNEETFCSGFVGTLGTL